MKFLLMPLSWLYAGGVSLNRRRMQRKPLQRLGVPVISVGNITVGGTGKTEAVALICNRLRSMGFNPGILSRGYSRQSREDVLVVSKGRGLAVSVAQAGDEPALLAKRLFDVPVVVGKDRAATGRIAVQDLGCDVLVLDDGFQRRDQVFRDLDIVLIDAGDPFGGRALLPAGRLREPMASLREADALVITRADQYPLKELFTVLDQTLGGQRAMPLITACHAAKQLVSLRDFTRQSLDYIHERPVLAVSGIARPQSFEKTLEQAGARILDSMRYPDHHWFTSQDLEAVARKARALDCAVVTTAKDAVRMTLDHHWEKVPVWYLDIEMEILSPKDGLEKLIQSVVAGGKK